jgi:hypothetical protein
MLLAGLHRHQCEMNNRFVFLSHVELSLSVKYLSQHTAIIWRSPDDNWYIFAPRFHHLCIVNDHESSKIEGESGHWWHRLMRCFSQAHGSHNHRKLHQTSMFILFLCTETWYFSALGNITFCDSQQRPFMNSTYYLVISDFMIRRSPQITSSLNEFNSVCIGITFLLQVTHRHTTCTGYCSEQFYPANICIILFKICLTVMLTLHMFSPFSLNYLHHTLLRIKISKGFLQCNFLCSIAHPS